MRVLLLLLAATDLANVTATGEHFPLFEAPFLSWEVANESPAIAVGDLNADGVVDIALPRQILFGQGGAHFAGGVPFALPTGEIPDIQCADLNADGLDDIVTANGLANTVSVLLSSVVGLGSRIDYPAGSWVRRVPAGDLNGDGRADVVAIAATSMTARVFLADASGQLQESQLLDLPSEPRDGVLADMNGDGELDLVVSAVRDFRGGIYRSGEVAVFHGNGNGTFSDGPRHLTSFAPLHVRAAHMNGDSPRDIVCTGYGSLTVFVADAVGNLTMTDAVSGLGGFAAIADLNHDARNDVVASISTGGGDFRVAVLSGQGDGTLGAQVICATGDEPTDMVLADVSADGSLDLVTMNVGSRTVGVLLGGEDGGFPDYVPVGPQSAAILVVADVNNDGHMDAILAASEILVRLGNGLGQFGMPFITPIVHPQAMVVGNFSADDLPDLAVMHSDVGDALRTRIFRGQGDGTFVEVQVLTRAGPMTSADINADGRDDLVLAGTLGTGEYYVWVYIAAADGSFGVPSQTEVAGRVSGVAVADMNGDGRLDVAASLTDLGTVQLAWGDGMGNLMAGPQSFAGPTVADIALSDLDGDGDVDVLATTGEFTGSGSLVTLKNTGGGSLISPITYDIGDTFFQIAAADFTRDGYPDVGVIAASRFISLFAGAEDGGLGSRQDYGIGNGNAMAVADVDEDGAADILVGQADGLLLLRNRQDISTPSMPAFIGWRRADVGIELEWYAPSLAGEGVTIERSRPGGDWLYAGESMVDGTGKITYRDRSWRTGTHAYRLAYRVDGQALHTDGVVVRIEDVVEELAIARVRATAGVIVLDAVIGRPGTVRVEVYDVVGRRIGGSTWRCERAGEMTMETPIETRASGVVFVRMEKDHQSVMRRVAMLR